jgi:hypothetical protein
MTQCRRLLAVFSLIFVALKFLAGQDVAADRSPVSDSRNRSSLVPKLTPNLAPPRYPSHLAPVWIPPPGLPRPYPIAPGAIGSQSGVFQQLVNPAGIIFSRATSTAWPALSRRWDRSPARWRFRFQVSAGTTAALQDVLETVPAASSGNTFPTSGLWDGSVPAPSVPRQMRIDDR